MSRRVKEDILKDRFIRQVLAEQALEIKRAQTNIMVQRRFRNVKNTPRGFAAQGNELQIEQKLLHRFIDIKTRRLGNGRKKRKKSHPIYNKVIFGHLNNIARELSFGYTDAAMEEMRSLKE